MDTLIFYGLVAACVFIAVWLLASPLRLGLKLALNTLLGFLALIAFNLLGKYIGITLGINLINALIVGVFGPAGLVLVLLLRWMSL